MRKTGPTAGGGLALALAVLLLSACGGRKEAAPPAPTPAPSPAAPGTAEGGGASREAQLELTREVLAFTLTDRVIDGVAAADRDLSAFWADPEKAKKVRGQLTYGAILSAVESTPEVASALEKNGLAPKEYVLGTFAMLGAYGYERARMADPKNVEGRKPPVNEPTLALIRKRWADVEKILVVPGPPPPR